MTQPSSVVVGAGPIGSALARRLAAEGQQVTVVSRSGRGPEATNIRRVALDATDAEALARAASGAATIYNCANPDGYGKWAAEWPPLAAGILGAAKSTGADLVTFSNLYGYGRVDGVITRNAPLKASDHKGRIRNSMWLDARAAHLAGRVRVTEVRASDYLGAASSTESGLLARYASATFRGKQAQVLGNPDQPHSWTYLDDVVTCMMALANNERAWGEAWLVPTNPPVSIRQVLQQMHAHIGLREPRLSPVPGWAISVLGAVVPVIREVKGVLYQFDRPFVMDSSETTDAFGLEATPWETVIRETAEAWKGRW